MYAIEFNCPDCSAILEIPSEQCGVKITCPECGNSITAPIPGLRKNLEIDNFVLERQIGHGGMGEVWLATQYPMERKVALKILSPKYSNDKDFIERFMREVKLTGRLEHQNLVIAFSAGTVGEFNYLAMSYVDGCELGERLKLDGMLQEREALKIARGIAEALKYAWEEHGMLHRDIKPSNIMIDSKGVPKLMDMGISRIIGESSTKEKSVVGTPYYISPEQARNDDDIDFRSDIYSLGATLYQMVCGRVPFEAESTKKILLKQIAEPLTPPKKINEKLSSNCSKLIRIMMSKDPSDRQSSWEYLIHDIDMVLNGQPPAERLESKNYETTRVISVSPEDLKDIGNNIHLVSKRMTRKENKVQDDSPAFVPEPGQQEVEQQPVKTEPAPPKVKAAPPAKVVNKRGKWRNIIFIILAALVIGGIVWGGWTLTNKIIKKINSSRTKTVETAP